MRLRLPVFSLMIFVFTISSCIKETYFGRSSYKSILYFTLSQQSGTTNINQDSLLIRISVSDQADITSLYPDSIQLSSYARIDPGKNTPQDFSEPVIYTVTAEDGSTAAYRVLVSKQTSTPQINNSSFDEWYTPAGKNYEEPGTDGSSEWATGNAGVVTLGAANTVPVNISGEDFAAEMATKDLGPLAQITGQRMAAATLFTGSFVLDITNPLNSPKFGIPFSARPAGFSVDYTYAPGTPYKNGDGQVLQKADSCDIYVFLENKDQTHIKRVATGWFRSGTAVNEFSRINIPLTYGELPAGTPVYQLPSNGLYASSSDVVTHITVVFASSANGALYEGGVSSTLTVNNFNLNY